MMKELSEYSAETLLEMIYDDVERDEDFGSRAEQSLLGRWRKGVDLDPLIALLESGTINHRLRGAYYLGQIALAVDDLLDVAATLGRDRLSECRSVFVGYMTNSGFYNERIARLLAMCLADFDLGVRLETINWAVSTTDDRFEDFRLLVESGAGLRLSKHWTRPLARRSLQALHIVKRLRAGHSVADIRGSMREVDGFTLDYLEAFEDRLKRYVETRVSAATNGLSPADQRSFDRGPVGEEYDRRGRLMSNLELLPNKLPAHVTDQQLDRMLALAEESLKQRSLDRGVFV